MKTLPGLHKAARYPDLDYSKVPLLTQCSGCRVLFRVQSLNQSFSSDWRMQRRIFAAGALRLKIQFPTARSKPSRSSGCRRVVSQCPGRHQAKVGAGPRSPREGMREGDNSLQLLHGQLHR